MVSSISSSMGNTVWANSSMQRGPQGKDPFVVADTDGDGSISQTELDAIAAGIEEITDSTIDSDITTYDIDEDGSLSNEELMAMLSANGFGPPELQGEEMQGPPPPPPPDDSFSTSSEDDSQDPFVIADTDEDGTISTSELTAEAETIAELIGTEFDDEEAFSEYDTDESGTLEQDEYMAMLAGSGIAPSDTMQGPPPPPPPSSAEAITAYTQFESEDPMSQLLDILSESEKESSTTSTVSVTT